MSSPDALQLESADELATSIGTAALAERGIIEPIAAVLPATLDSGNGVAAAHVRRGLPSFFSGTLFRKGALSLVDQALVSATNFLTMVLLGRTAEQELGVYQLGFSLVLLAMCVQNALISSPYALFGNRLDGERRAQYAGSTLLHQGAFSVFAAVMLAIVGLGIGAGWGLNSFGYVAWILAAMLPFILLREFVRRVAFAHLQLITVVCLDAGVSAMQLGGLMLLRFGGHLNAATAFGAVGAACALAGGATFLLMRGHFAPERGSALSDLRLNWSFGKWAFGAQVLGLTSAYCLPWMLALLRGAGEAGRYAACLSIVLIANPLLLGLNNFLSPQAIHAYHRDGLKGLRRLTSGISFWLTGALALLTVLLVLFGGRVLAMLYGQKLQGNELPVALLALNTLVLAAGIGAENGLIALNRPASNFCAYFVGQLVILAACFLLIVPYGVSGAATAALLGIIAATLVKIALFARACRQQPGRSAG